MLYTKFQGSKFLGSGEEKFQKILPFMGMMVILINRLEPFKQTFVPPVSGG